MSDLPSVRALVADLRILAGAWQRHLSPQRLDAPVTGIPRVDVVASGLRSLSSGFFGRRRILPYFSPFEAQRLRLSALATAQQRELRLQLQTALGQVTGRGRFRNLIK